MKRNSIIVALIVVAVVALTSCTASRAGGGCKMNRGFIGYGYGGGR
ncbi:MAG: hypothetical protein QM731_01010 [Chitinophagaceae bacterium]